MCNATPSFFYRESNQTKSQTPGHAHIGIYRSKLEMRKVAQFHVHMFDIE